MLILSGIFVDYPPLYIYVLAIIGTIAKALNLSSGGWALTLLIKLPSIIADIVTAFLLYKLSQNRLKPKTRLFLVGLYLFNPVVILNSTFWGQVDSFLAMLVVLALYLLSLEKIGLSSVMFALVVLMKPQGIIFLLIFYFELLRRRNVRNILVSIATGLITAVVVILPFSIGQKPQWIFDLYLKTAAGYKFATINAFNLFAFAGANWKPDSGQWLGISYSDWGYMFIFLLVILTAVIYRLGKNVGNLSFLSSAMLITGVFLFSVRMHERYMFPALILLLLGFAFLKDWRLLLLFYAFTITNSINTAMVYSRSLDNNYWIPSGDTGLIIVSALNLLLFPVFIWTALEISRGRIMKFKEDQLIVVNKF